MIRADEGVDLASPTPAFERMAREIADRSLTRHGATDTPGRARAAPLHSARHVMLYYKSGAH